MEFEFTDQAVKEQYTRDKVEEYERVVNHPKGEGYTWERTEPNGSKLRCDLTAKEVQRVVDYAAYHLSRELNSVGVVYQGKPKE